MAEANLTAQIRYDKKKQMAKKIRNQGSVPAVLYGVDIEPTLLTINQKTLFNLLHKNGRNVIVNLELDDRKEKLKVFIYDIQHHPLSGEISHVDFKHISLTEKIDISVPVKLIGTPVGVKTEGGILEHILHKVDISCLPTNIPESIDIDVTDLHLGAIIHVKDVKVNDFKIMSDPESVIVHIVVPKVAKISEEQADGEAGPAEPKIIGKKEKEEEE